MIHTNIQAFSVLVAIVFFSSIMLHIARRNSTSMLIYILQSFAVSSMLFLMGVYSQSISFSLIAIAVLTFLVKCICAPFLFSKFISKKQLAISTTTYVNVPITLAIILALTIFIKSGIFLPVVSLSDTPQLLTFSLAGIFISLFLMINKRAVFSQLIGILSFENGMVAFTILSGVEHTLAIEIGILFDLALWIIISSVLVKMIYSHFGSLHTNVMNRLKE